MKINYTPFGEGITLKEHYEGLWVALNKVIKNVPAIIESNSNNYKIVQMSNKGHAEINNMDCGHFVPKMTCWNFVVNDALEDNELFVREHRKYHVEIFDY